LKTIGDYDQGIVGNTATGAGTGSAPVDVAGYATNDKLNEKVVVH
jgi:hypothetical protein